MTSLVNQEFDSIKSNGKAPKTLSEAKERADITPLGMRPKAVFRQVAMCLLGNLCVLTTGMGLGYPAATLKELQDPNEKAYLTPGQASWFASINAIASPLGGLLSSYLLDKVGRKRTFFTIHITALISWAMLALATDASSELMFIQIMIARFIIGIATGLASSPVGVYSAEISHPTLRGRLTLGTSISTAIGITLIYVMGYFIRDDFRFISAIICVYVVIATLLTIPLPESPNWLIMKGRKEEAKQSLRFFRGLGRDATVIHPEFEAEFEQLSKLAEKQGEKKSQRASVLIRKPEIYKPLLIMITFFGFQQFSGIFVIIVYAAQFSVEAGVAIDPLLCAILIGATRVVTTFIMGYFLDKFGRRPPAMASGLGMALSMFILAGTTWFPEFNLPYLNVICIISFIFTSTLGLMTLPFSMISEVYPQTGRGFAAGLTIFCGYIMSFINIKVYPTMVTTLGNENVFAIYGTISALAVFFVYFFLPETKGRTLHEIEAYFKNERTTKSEKSDLTVISTKK